MGSARWRCWPTAAAPSPAPMTTRCGCGIWRPARPCAPSKGTPIRSARWRCWPTAAAPSPAPMTTRCGCGISTTGETLRTLEGHTVWVSAVAVLADGSRALSGSCDNTLRLWDLDDRRDPAHPRRAHRLGSARWRCWPTAAAPSPAPVTTRCGCGIWRPARPCAPSKGTPIGSRAVAVLADGSRALSGS